LLNYNFQNGFIGHGLLLHSAMVSNLWPNNLFSGKMILQQYCWEYKQKKQEVKACKVSFLFSFCSYWLCKYLKISFYLYTLLYILYFNFNFFKYSWCFFFAIF